MILLLEGEMLFLFNVLCYFFFHILYAVMGSVV
jgi:hypothetical protein